MASESKKRKTAKKLHYGRSRKFLKSQTGRLKGVYFYTSSQRQKEKKIDNIEE